MALETVEIGRNPRVRAQKNSDGTHAVATMSDIHAHIHAGEMFASSSLDLAIANNASIDVLVRVASGGSAHLRPTIGVGGNTHTFIYEDPTISADGSAISRINRNRFSLSTSNTLVFSGPTVTDVGDLLAETFTPGGGVFIASGSSQQLFENEWVLSPGDYLIRATNISGSAKAMSIFTEWYEDGV